MTHATTVCYRGVDIACEYELTRDHSSQYVDCASYSIAGVDVTDLLTKDQQQDIQVLILESYADA